MVPFLKHQRLKVFISLGPEDVLPNQEEVLDCPLEDTSLLYSENRLTKAGSLSLNRKEAHF